MYLPTLLLGLLAPLSTLAISVSTSTTKCLTDSDAHTVASNFGTLLSAYSNASADAFLTPDLQEYSDSIIEIINSGCPNSPLPLGAPLFTSREAFKASQGAQPNIPFTVLNVWHDCSNVTFRWRSDMKPGIVTGVNVLETVWQGGKFVIKTAYAEFNSGSWLVNIGVFKPSGCRAAS